MRMCFRKMTCQQINDDTSRTQVIGGPITLIDCSLDDDSHQRKEDFFPSCKQS